MKKANFIFKLIAVFSLAIVSVLVGSNGTVRAEANDTNVYIRNTNDFYAYVKNGENLDLNFTKHNNLVPGSVTATIRVQGMDGVNQTCTIADTAPDGTSCGFTNLTASTSGTWKITFSVPEEAANKYSWQINVQNGSTNITGRVWSTAYYASNGGSSNQLDNIATFDYFYQSRQGYLYRGIYRNYNGIDSIFRANNFGIVEPGTCDPLYQSYPVSSVGKSGQALNIADDPANSDVCGGKHKLFFNNPAADLPESAPRWDGADWWIKPSIKAQTISNLKFIPSAPGAMSGKLTFDTANYEGGGKVLVDIDGNGSYDDAVDRSFDVGVGWNKTVQFNFDGKDTSGNPIANDKKISFLARLGKPGEIHFVNADAEHRAGGVEVRLQNGPSQGYSTIFWNDTPFQNTVNIRCSTTPQLDGTAGVNSTGGVHGWDASGCANFGNNNNLNDSLNTGSWGDTRFINDWTYSPTPVIAAELVYYPTSEVKLDKIATSDSTPAMPGSVIDYELTFTVIKTPAIDVKITDKIPLGTSYVPGSLEITQDDGNASNVGGKSDEAGDDTAEFSSDNPNQVTFRVGEGADATKGGVLQPGQVAKVKFKVKVDEWTNESGQKCPVSRDPNYFNNGKGDGSRGEDLNGDPADIDNVGTATFMGGSVDAPAQYTNSPLDSNRTYTPTDCLPKVADTGSASKAKTALALTGLTGAGLFGAAVKKRGLLGAIRMIARR